MSNPWEGSDDNYTDVDQYTIHSMPSSFMCRATGLFSVMKGEKARMLRDIGFSGLRRIGEWGRLDDHFTMWLLRNLDTKTMCIATSRATVIPVTDVDVFLVMGTQKDGTYVYEEENVCAEELDIMLRRLFVSEEQGCLTTEHLEHLLSREYNACTPEPEKDAFKIAAVLYSWAMIFSVDATYPVIPYGILKNLSDTSMIKDFNWSALILKGVRNAALTIQGSIASGLRKLYITGCPLFMQVFYIDNLDFGDNTLENIFLPRITQYTEANIIDFIHHDHDPHTGFFHEYGITQAIVNEGVVYSHSVSWGFCKHVTEDRGKKTSKQGQSSSLMEQLKEALKANSEELKKKGLLKTFVDVSSSNNNNIEAAIEGMHVSEPNAESSTVSRPSVRNFDVSGGSPGEKAIQTTFRRGSVYNVFKRFKTFSTPKKPGPSRKKCVATSRFRPTPSIVASTNQVDSNQHNGSLNNEDPLMMPGITIDPQLVNGSDMGDQLAGSTLHLDNMGTVPYVNETVDFDMENLAMVPYVKAKLATNNSEYPESPFDLNMPHPIVDKKHSRALHRVLESGIFHSRVWFENNLIWGTSLTGSELAEQMKRGGIGVGVCDVVILSHAEFDGQMYGSDRKHWKGYLPVSFAKIVFGAIGDEYLHDDRVRDMFIGDHLKYDFEHYRKIVAPVEFDQSYSCYIWDLSAMECHVLDPVLMNTSEKRAEEHHSWAIQFLTAALVKCVKAFFHGWSLLGDWFMSVSTNFSQRCRPSNSAMYTLHYARWYNVIGIEKITDPELGDIRVGMLYQIVSMERNAASFRTSLICPKLVSRASSSGTS